MTGSVIKYMLGDEIEICEKSCLLCKLRFVSRGKHNRLCDVCRDPDLPIYRKKNIRESINLELVRFRKSIRLNNVK